MLTATDGQRSDKDTSYLMLAYIYSQTAFSYIFIIKAAHLNPTSIRRLNSY